MNNIIFDSFIIPKYNKMGKFLRKVNSFTCRYRSLKQIDVDFLKKHWLSFGINFQTRVIDIHNCFKNNTFPIILDIGFGNGESLSYTYSHFMHCNIIGIEVYKSGINNIIKKISSYKSLCDNIKIIAHDAIEVLQYMIQNNSISIVQLFFPDPWPKKRHHKRRIVNKNFIQILANKIILGGILHIITDCISYFNSIIQLVNNIKYFINISHCYNHRIINNKIITRFSRRSKVKNIFNIILQCIK